MKLPRTSRCPKKKNVCSADNRCYPIETEEAVFDDNLTAEPKAVKVLKTKVSKYDALYDILFKEPADIKVTKAPFVQRVLPPRYAESIEELEEWLKAYFKKFRKSQLLNVPFLAKKWFDFQPVLDQKLKDIYQQGLFYGKRNQAPKSFKVTSPKTATAMETVKKAVNTPVGSKRLPPRYADSIEELGKWLYAFYKAQGKKVNVPEIAKRMFLHQPDLDQKLYDKYKHGLMLGKVKYERRMAYLAQKTIRSGPKTPKVATPTAMKSLKKAAVPTIQSRKVRATAALSSKVKAPAPTPIEKQIADTPPSLTKEEYAKTKTELKGWLETLTMNKKSPEEIRNIFKLDKVGDVWSDQLVKKYFDKQLQLDKILQFYKLSLKTCKLNYESQNKNKARAKGDRGEDPLAP
jgi:hypothetical protein